MVIEMPTYKVTFTKQANVIVTATNKWSAIYKATERRIIVYDDAEVDCVITDDPTFCNICNKPIAEDANKEDIVVDEENDTFSHIECAKDQ